MSDELAMTASHDVDGAHTRRVKSVVGTSGVRTGGSGVKDHDDEAHLPSYSAIHASLTSSSLRIDAFNSEEVTLILSLGSHCAAEKLGLGMRVGIDEEAHTSALEHDA